MEWTDLKLPEILARAGDRHFAWVDDDVQLELQALREHGAAPALGERSLLIQSDPSIGLTETHMEELLAFAARDRPGDGRT